MKVKYLIIVIASGFYDEVKFEGNRFNNQSLYRVSHVGL